MKLVPKTDMQSPTHIGNPKRSKNHAVDLKNAVSYDDTSLSYIRNVIYEHVI
jgi:hypothetical protein